MSHSGTPDPLAAGHRPGPLTTVVYSAAEWQMLTRLPGRVIVAVTSVAPDDPIRVVNEALAGLDGIAAGRAFDSDLVRAVVAAIYAESDDGQPPIARRTDQIAGRVDLLAACRAATALLAARADPADSAAYRQWVQSVAARVCQVGGGAGWIRPPGDRCVPANHEFLDNLGEALGLRASGLTGGPYPLQSWRMAKSASGRGRVSHRPIPATTRSCWPTVTGATWSTATATGGARPWSPTWTGAGTTSTWRSRTGSMISTSARWCVTPTPSSPPRCTSSAGGGGIGGARWSPTATSMCGTTRRSRTFSPGRTRPICRCWASTTSPARDRWRR